MWPFTPKTLYDRYSKLMKLILSIDSHFEVTENEDNSMRLHLSNYKGNQQMDFHIYLMEPFLFISFVTEVEGEKVSMVNSYPQDMDQQDIFNASMASNLERMRQVMEAKYKKKDDDNEKIAEGEAISNSPKSKDKPVGISKVWPLLEFAKEQGKMQVGEFVNKETGDEFKACIFTKPDGTRTFVAFAAKMGELSPTQIVAMKDQLQVAQLESGNYSLCEIGSGSWKDVNLSKSDVNQQERSNEQKEKSHDKESSDGMQKTVWDEIERQLHEFETLNEGQKHALYYYASLIGCDEYTRWHIEKVPQALIDFQILLDISNPVAQNIASPNSYMSVPYRERDIISIKNSYILTHFIKVCKSLQELRDNKFTRETYEEIINLIEISTGITSRGDDYYFEKYGMSKDEYFRKNYNEVTTLTAKCVEKESWYPVRKDYLELEIGKTYKVSHIGVFRSFTRVVLEDFGDKEFDAGCFELFENGIPIDRRYTDDHRFWAPYLREKFDKN